MPWTHKDESTLRPRITKLRDERCQGRWMLGPTGLSVCRTGDLESPPCSIPYGPLNLKSMPAISPRIQRPLNSSASKRLHRSEHWLCPSRNTELCASTGFQNEAQTCLNILVNSRTSQYQHPCEFMNISISECVLEISYIGARCVATCSDDKQSP